MIKESIQAIFLFLPAIFANMAPVIFLRLKFLGYPISERLFGSNKTYRGFFFGIMLAILAVGIQKLIYPFISADYVIIDYAKINSLLLGFLLGFGALFGDLIKSFFKRRLKIEPGKPMVIADQIDWVIGSFIFASFYIAIPAKIFLIAIILFGIATPIINFASYKLKLRKTKI